MDLVVELGALVVYFNKKKVKIETYPNKVRY